MRSFSHGGLSGWVPVWMLLIGSCLAPAMAEPLVKVSFGSDSKAAGFVLEGGRKVLSLAGGGSDLRSARVEGRGAMSGIVTDSVSRLVVMYHDSALGAGLALGESAPASGSLTVAGTGSRVQLIGRVERIRGKYLPFTLLRVRYSGRAPVPGTPLLNHRRQVVALSCEPVAGEGSYALPVEVMRRVLNGPQAGGSSKRAWLGIVLNPGSGSSKVSRVVEGSPASQAGIRAGDVLTEVNGWSVADYGDAVNAFFLLMPGEVVRVKVQRGGRPVTLQLTPRIAS